tara:strand:+ start:792 stop:1160 length:369 start_codon:yes stop_codon:yes gene_type:complete
MLNKLKAWDKKRKRIKFYLKDRNKNNLYRLVIYRSNTNIYAQLVNDEKHITVLSTSSIDKDLEKTISTAKSKVDKSEIVGNEIAKKMKKAKIESIIFDRNGYKYHGRIKALGEAVRKSGINF